MKKGTLIIGKQGSGKSTKAHQLIAGKKHEHFFDFESYKHGIPMYHEETQFLVFEEVNVKDTSVIEYFNNLLQILDRVEAAGLEIPEIIVVSQLDFFEQLPKGFVNDRWLVIHAKEYNGQHSTTSFITT